MSIVKKYVIAMDSQVPMFSQEHIRMFMFSRDTKYNTMEEAEKHIERMAKDDVCYIILPIYVKG